MRERFYRIFEQSFFLFGPSGVGKTRFIKKLFPKALWVDFQHPRTFLELSAGPERLEKMITSRTKQIVIDEVQNVPEILSLVHKLIEERKEIQFILICSSRAPLKRERADLLAGRALLKYMHPFVAAELGDQFDLEKALQVGLLPVAWQDNGPQEALRNHLCTYLKNALQGALIKNSYEFAHFLEKVSTFYGVVVNETNIARECFVKRHTVSNYLQILQDLLIAFFIPVFRYRAKRNLSVQPKFYFFDVGIFRSLRDRGPGDGKREIEGAALEGLVAQHLRFWIDSQVEKYALSFWRTRRGLEVDFIVYGPDGFWAIEVKNGMTISPNDLKGLIAFQKDYPECKPLLLYRGKDRRLIRGIHCFPVEEFLHSVHPKQLLCKDLF